MKDFPTLAKSYVAAQKFVGGSVRVPKDDAPQEEWDKFYGKLGRPESADGYQFPIPDVDLEAPLTKHILGTFKKTAHGLGLTPRQAQGIALAYVDMERQAEKTNAAATATRIEELKTEWGAAYENNIAIARSAARQLFGQRFIDSLNRSGYGNDPDLIRGMLKVGKDLMEDGVIEVGEGFSSLQSTQDEINKVLNLSKEERLKHPYWNRNLEGHAEAVDRMFKLQEILANTGRA